MGKTKEHWEQVYETNPSGQLSWTQQCPKTSLAFVRALGLGKDAAIIDVGGGDSNLVDFLLNEGYENITVLDISGTAIERAKHRLGSRAEKVHWIVCDILDFEPTNSYDLWHDRATLHFLTNDEQVKVYVDKARRAVTGHLVIGVFSANGPQKCSGLNVRQYTEEKLVSALGNGFEKIRCITDDHITPFGAVQNFLFCIFSSTGPE